MKSRAEVEENQRTHKDKVVRPEETNVRQYKTEISQIKTIKVKEAIKIQQKGIHEEEKKARTRQRGQDRWDMHREEWQKGETNQLQDIEEESLASQASLERGSSEKNSSCTLV